MPLLAGGFLLAPASPSGYRRSSGAALVSAGLLGWAGVSRSGHLGKLLSLSLWVWWPPGPRPKQAALYPRWVWLAEAVSFAFGVEVLAVGALAGSLDVTIAGGMHLLAAAALAITGAGAGVTWAARW